MFNMLLAIVFETYSTVRTEIGNNAETLFSQLYSLVRRGIQTRKGTRVNGVVYCDTGWGEREVGGGLLAQILKVPLSVVLTTIWSMCRYLQYW